VQPVELDAFLAEVRSAGAALFEGGQLQLELELGAQGARVAVDRSELQRVFVNLLQNSAQAAGRQVVVRIASSVADGRAEVRVRDDGPGIPDAVRARLFEPYFTTRTAGTGLGLAICRRIVEQCGGAIRLESTGSSGTVFCIELPLLPAA
jgi:signal transduction histidine kinase